MTELEKQKCVPCSGDVPTATEEEIDRYKTQIPDWKIINENEELHLQRVYQFPDFKTALDFSRTSICFCFSSVRFNWFIGLSL